MKLGTKAKISQKAFQKRVDILMNIIDESGNAAAKYVTLKSTEQEYMDRRKQILLDGYNSLFKGNAYEA